ncbi:MAG: hypothetical protein NTV09_01775 [Bacteroidetes bacterium]|nr:hypothetical protein [Bacteroidota bacterium]
MKLYCLIIALVFSTNVFAQNLTPKNLVKEEASLNVLSFLNLIPEGREREYGFTDRSDFSKIKIEEPYETFYVKNNDKQFLFVAGNEWRVPISIEGQYVSLLTVRFNNSKAEVVDLGGNILSGKIQEYEKLVPGAEGKRVLIRNTFLNQDYIANDIISLCKESEQAGLLTINTLSTEPLYKINEGLPEKTSTSAFCEATIAIINHSTDLK